MLEGELAMIDSEEVKERGVEGVNVDRVLHHIVGEVVGFSVDDAALDSRPRQPLGVAARMVVTSKVSR